MPPLPARRAARSGCGPRHALALLSDGGVDALHTGAGATGHRARCGGHRRPRRARRIRRAADDSAVSAPGRGDGRGDVPALGALRHRRAGFRRPERGGRARGHRRDGRGDPRLDGRNDLARGPRREGRRRCRRAGEPPARWSMPLRERPAAAFGGCGARCPRSCRRPEVPAGLAEADRAGCCPDGPPTPGPSRTLPRRAGVRGLERLPRRGPSHAGRHAGRRPRGRPRRGRARSRAVAATARRRDAPCRDPVGRPAAASPLGCRGARAEVSQASSRGRRGVPALPSDWRPHDERAPRAPPVCSRLAPASPSS